MRVEEASEASDELVAAFARLLPQLSTSSSPPTAAEVAALVTSPATVVFIARDDNDGGKIVGSLTLALFRIPTGLRAWIEDVVVDAAARGHSLGEKMTQAAIDKARGLGAKTVELTSRPSREAANHIYKKMGFELRETNVYRYDLSAS